MPTDSRMLLLAGISGVGATLWSTKPSSRASAPARRGDLAAAIQPQRIPSAPSFTGGSRVCEGCARMAEHHVRAPMGEAEGLIEPDSRRVGLIDVQHHLAETTGPQVVQADQGKCAAKSRTTLARIHAHHVHLTHRFVAMSGAALPGTAPVDLGPVEAHQMAVALGEEEAGRFEPCLPLTLVDRKS